MRTWCWLNFTLGDASDGWYLKGSNPPPYVACVRAAGRPSYVPAGGIAPHHGMLAHAGGHAGIAGAIILVVIVIALIRKYA